MSFDSRALSSGQSAVELALVSIVLIVVLLGASDFARVYFLSSEVKSAARAGVQYGTQATSNSVNLSGMQQAALNDAPDIQGMTATASQYCQCPDGTQFSCSTVNSCNDKRTYIQVNTSATFTLLIHWPGLPATLPVNATATMRIQ